MAPLLTITPVLEDPPDPPRLIPPDLLAIVFRENFFSRPSSSSIPLAEHLSADPSMLDSRVVVSSPVLDTPESLVSAVVVDSPVLVNPSPSLAPPEVRPAPTQLWASRFSSSICNLKKVSPLSFMDDGIPSVIAPHSVMLMSEDVWKDHLVAQFHGSPPSVAKMFSDLNPIWGS